MGDRNPRAGDGTRTASPRTTRLRVPDRRPPHHRHRPFRPPARHPHGVAGRSRRMGGRVVRSLAFHVDALPDGLRILLTEFRLLVNRSIRIALREDIRSQVRLQKVAYATLSAEHDVYKQYIPSAFGVALSMLKAHRRRGRPGRRAGGSDPAK